MTQLKHAMIKRQTFQGGEEKQRTPHFTTPRQHQGIVALAPGATVRPCCSPTPPMAVLPQPDTVQAMPPYGQPTGRGMGATAAVTSTGWYSLIIIMSKSSVW